ncbi:MAG: OmpA family protein [Planctomycetes bacterium]|nr:OmpA family protein [Planctomycetota bacterium]
MSILARISLFSIAGLSLFAQTACTLVPRQTLRYSQLRTMQMHNQNRAIASERNQLVAEKQQLEQSLNTANARMDNLNQERATLQQRYVSLLNRNSNLPNPMDPETSRRMKELSEKYKGFEFDPSTGISKFGQDVLFNSGSDQIKSSGAQILRDFAQVMNQGSAEDLNILVVGHTDDKRISKRSTHSRHPTNWHLSTNRAASVVLALSKSKVKESRMAIGGHSKYQPIVPNKSEAARRKNRRVEIFVLAPEAKVAGWDPATSRN